MSTHEFLDKFYRTHVSVKFKSSCTILKFVVSFQYRNEDNIIKTLGMFPRVFYLASNELPIQNEPEYLGSWAGEQRICYTEGNEKILKLNFPTMPFMVSCALILKT